MNLYQSHSPKYPSGGSGVVLLSSFYLAPIQYYSKFFNAGRVLIEIHDNYQKQSYRNRCVIVGAGGSVPLSIPTEKPETIKCPMKEIRIADHGNWRHLHWNAILSAYNSTPFFEYYADELQPFYEKKIPFLLDFNLRLHELICRWLLIETPTTLSTEYISRYSGKVFDFRETIHPKKDWKELDKEFTAKPYYQVFREKWGFIENVSIIDLIFNMGNEARLYL